MKVRQVAIRAQQIVINCRCLPIKLIDDDDDFLDGTGAGDGQAFNPFF